MKIPRSRFIRLYRKYQKEGLSYSEMSERLGYQDNGAVSRQRKRLIEKGVKLPEPKLSQNRKTVARMHDILKDMESKRQ